MPAAGLAAAFEHIEKPDEIGVRIGVRIDQRVAHARLRGEMHDLRKSMRGEQCRNARAIRKIALLELKGRKALEARRAAPASEPDRNRR